MVAALVLMAERLVTSGDVDVSRVAVQAWAESLRNERVHAIAAATYGALRGHLVTACRRSLEAGGLPAGTDPEVAGQVLFSLVPGFLLQRLLLGDVDGATYTATLLTLMGVRDR